MDADEILTCMRHASEALAELQLILHEHSREAHREVEQAQQHFEYAISLLKRAGPHGGQPRMRLVW